MKENPQSTQQNTKDCKGPLWKNDMPTLDNLEKNNGKHTIFPNWIRKKKIWKERLLRTKLNGYLKNPKTKNPRLNAFTGECYNLKKS